MPTPLTQAGVVNRALQLVGGWNNSGPVTGSAPNFDGSVQGRAAGAVYDECVQLAGRQFGWDFSRNIATLEQSANTPPLGWGFEYLYPPNGIQIRQVLPPDADIDPLDPRPIRWGVGNNLGGVTTAIGSVFWGVKPVNGSTLTLNGRVFTFVTSGATGSNYQINIQSTTAQCVTSLWVALTTGSTYLADPLLNVATYTNVTPFTTLGVAYAVPGIIGNTFTLAASVATPSGPTLTGGTSFQLKMIWCDFDNAQGVITNQPPEATWDALYTETVVQIMGSKLNMALSSKPESSKLAAQQGAIFEQSGEQRTDT